MLVSKLAKQSGETVGGFVENELEGVRRKVWHTVIVVDLSICGEKLYGRLGVRSKNTVSCFQSYSFIIVMGFIHSFWGYKIFIYNCEGSFPSTSPYANPDTCPSSEIREPFCGAASAFVNGLLSDPEEDLDSLGCAILRVILTARTTVADSSPNFTIEDSSVTSTSAAGSDLRCLTECDNVVLERLRKKLLARRKRFSLPSGTKDRRRIWPTNMLSRKNE